MVDILFRHCLAKNFYVIARSVFNPQRLADFLILTCDFMLGEWVREFSGSLIRQSDQDVHMCFNLPEFDF